MSKTPITWLELIKQKLSEEKSKGKSPSIGDVTPLAKKEWVQIKEGKHPKYIQGKAKTYARKKGKGEGKKTRKNGKKGDEVVSSPAAASATPSASADLTQLLSELKLCGKCKKAAMKLMKKKGMKGGCGDGGGMCSMPSAV
jgi:hypothetical protein